MTVNEGNEKAQSNLSDALGSDIPGLSAVVQPNWASATCLGPGCVIEHRASCMVRSKSSRVGAPSLSLGIEAGPKLLSNQSAGFFGTETCPIGGPSLLHLWAWAHVI